MTSLKTLIFDSLKEAGACAVGVSEAGPVDALDRERFEAWLAAGMHAGMEYMERNREIRFDPRLLLDGARSVISMAFSYRQPNPVKGVATYALGLDYHNVLKRRIGDALEAVKADFGGDFRICVDSAPVMERYWAVRSGVGYRSPDHGNIVVPGVGSMVFLAEVVTTHALEADGKILPDAGGVASGDGEFCKVCPSGALRPSGMIDARRCINYLTIEHRGSWNSFQEEVMSGPVASQAIFGCDICLRGAAENQGEIAVVPLPELLLHPGLEDFVAYVRSLRESNGDVPERPLFPLRKSAMSRVGMRGLLRNPSRQE